MSVTRIEDTMSNDNKSHWLAIYMEFWLVQSEERNK